MFETQAVLGSKAHVFGRWISATASLLLCKAYKGKGET